MWDFCLDEVDVQFDVIDIGVVIWDRNYFFSKTAVVIQFSF